ncbi:MAG: hypothetical protein WCF90_10120 [Methanomicrobiales archaeon]
MLTKTIPHEQFQIHTPCRIREKIREVFGRETSMNDDTLLKRYALSGDGDLVMILRGYP